MSNSKENIAYYDAIATEYNEMLDKKPDRLIREKVANKFCNIVKEAIVLDFGGGTGLDLEWLAANNNTIFFCEPSAGMRQKAMSTYTGAHYKKVIFFENADADFTQWSLKSPFTVKVNAVLANFAVLNCIRDVKLLFQNLAIIVKPGSNMFALVLTGDATKPGRIFNNIFKTFSIKKTATVVIKYRKHHQTVYLHSISEIINSSAQYFDFCSSEIFKGSPFTLIHLQRK